MLSSLTNQLHHFIRKDLSSSRFWHQKAQDILKFLYFVRKDIGEKYCLQRASGMAYTSLMAMVPTLIVFVSVFSSVKFFPAHVKGKIEFLIFQNFIPETSQKIADKIAATIQTFTSAAATIGLIGAVFMVLSVFFLLNTIEHIFNSIMEAEKERTLLHKLSAYTTIMVWSALLTGLSMYFASQTDIVKNIPFIDQLNAFFHYGFIVIAFTLAYKMIPNKSIATRNAFAGGIVATILWEIARKGFSNYTSKLVGFDQIYGTLGIIPLFLLWLYLVWMVLLIGMEVTYV
ncbi:MAG: YihY family inner membrane protein, partial [Candidatus Aureabacteria bacterium]|nr:YihY family inner membrane protein [Candidatus Auribacterota bacterium]